MSAAPAYAELHCLSCFSFQRGASNAKELFARARQQGYRALAITDECTLAGIVRAHQAARDAELTLIIGSEMRIDDGPRCVLLVEDARGYEALCGLITRARRRAKKGQYQVLRSDFDTGCDGLLALWLPDEQPDREHARWLQSRFPQRAWLAVELHRGPHDEARLRALLTLAAGLGLPAVASGDVHMHVRRRRALQDTMTAIRLRTPLSSAGHALFPNGERHLRTRPVIASIYPAALMDESVRIAERCNFSLDRLDYHYPSELTPAGDTPTSHLRALVEAGFAWRWPHGDAEARALVEKELAIIGELGYEPYFLTVHDIVRFARSRGILCQGRGSAANSAVCYALGITELRPGITKMLFERFISRERNEPPDIDVDFEHERREEVLQYVFEKYGRDRAALTAVAIQYRGRSAVRDVAKALGLPTDQITELARTMDRWSRDAPLPDYLREHGFDPDSPIMQRLIVLTSQLVGMPRHLSQHPGGFVISERALSTLVPVENAAMADRTIIQWDKDDLDELGLLKVDCLALGMLTCIRKTLELLRASGRRDMTVDDIPQDDAATYAMIQPGDTIGVFQIESRAQMAMLPRLRPKCFYDLVIQVAIVRPGPIQGDMVHPYLRRRNNEEPVTYPSEALREVFERTLGVPLFQEQVMQLAITAAGYSAGEADQLRRSMAAWKRHGGMEHHRQKITEGMLANGYTAEFADRVFEQIKGFGSYGFPESHAASFALITYVSCWLKCHEPAAFAASLLNSQPMGFYSPSQIVQDARRHRIDVRPVDIRSSYWDCSLESDAASEVAIAASVGVAGADRVRKGATVATVATGANAATGRNAAIAATVANAATDSTDSADANDAADAADANDANDANDTNDTNDTNDAEALPTAIVVADLSRQPALRLGLRMVDGLGEACARRIEAARRANPFTDATDLCTRAALDRRERDLLSDAGALHGLLGHRHKARWMMAGVEAQRPLFETAGETPEIAVTLPVPSVQDDVRTDYDTLGLTLGRHPLSLLRDVLSKRRFRRARELRIMDSGRGVAFAGLVTMRQRPQTASGVTFVTLEDEDGLVNVIVWKQVAERYRRVLLESRLLAVRGTVESKDGVQHVIARSLENLDTLLGPLATSSRDFH